MPVVPRGGGSGVMGAAVPYAGGVVVDVSAMDRVIEIDDVSLTATVEAGLNGRAFERLLNERGLSFPHFPASAEWASVGGYVAARGSGVLSSRYGKIEDQVVSLRVVTPTGAIIDTVPVPRHAVGPGADAALRRLGGHAGRHHARHRQADPAARATGASRPSRCRTLQAGIDGLRDVMQRGLRPAVIRFYDAEASSGSLSPIVGRALDAPTALLMFEGEREVADAEADVTLRRLAEQGGDAARARAVQHVVGAPLRLLPPAPLPDAARRCGARSTRSRRTTASSTSTTASARRSRRSPRTGLRAAHPLQPLVRVGHDGLPALRDRRRVGRRRIPLALYKEIWRAGVEAILDAGGVINDHHGVGSTLAPYLERQWGPAFGTLREIKRALDPAGRDEPGQARPLSARSPGPGEHLRIGPCCTEGTRSAPSSTRSSTARGRRAAVPWCSGARPAPARPPCSRTPATARRGCTSCAVARRRVGVRARRSPGCTSSCARRSTWSTASRAAGRRAARRARAGRARPATTGS